MRETGALEGASLPAGDDAAVIGASQLGEYAQSILLELRAMAIGTGCSYLAYLLELALIEASDLEAGRAPSRVAARSVSGTVAPDLEEIARRILSAASQRG